MVKLNIYMLFAGLALIMLGIAAIIISTREEGGFIVIVGPIPFFVGSGKGALIAALLLALAVLPLLYLFLLLLRPAGEEVVV